jgi:hypothetical protein
METILLIIITAVSTKGALDAWFEGSLFATARAYTEAWKYSDSTSVSLIGELFTCRFCLGYHVAFYLATICCYSISDFSMLPLIALSARVVESELEKIIRRFDEPRNTGDQDAV